MGQQDDGQVWQEQVSRGQQRGQAPPDHAALQEGRLSSHRVSAGDTHLTISESPKQLLVARLSFKVGHY